MPDLWNTCLAATDFPISNAVMWVFGNNQM
jgi:hypothetical protein